MKRAELFFSTLLLPVDALMLWLGFVLSYYLRDSFAPLAFPQGITSLSARLKYNPAGTITLPFDRYLHYLGFIIPALLVIFGLMGLYTIRPVTGAWRKIAHIFISVSVGEFFVLLLFLLKKDFFIPRGTVLYSWLFCTLFVIGGRWLIRQFQKKAYRRGIGLVRVGIIGKNTTADQVATHFAHPRTTGYELALQLENSVIPNILKQLRAHHIDELIVVSEKYTNDQLIALRNHCLEEQVGFSFVPPLLTALPSTFDIRLLVGLPVIEVRPTPLEGWGRVVKRIFDIIGALFFIVLFSPFYLVCAIWIKLDDPSGPLIYKHPRVGKDRTTLYVWKFRSFKWKYCTHVGHSGDEHFRQLLESRPDLAKEWKESMKLKNDPRVSAPGRIMRKTHLDELPQFFNVLYGKLSLVGPRPILTDEISRFGEKARILFTVKPGITGPWQVKGGNDLSYEERVILNAEYIEHWTLWADVIILLKTALLMLTRKTGGY